MPGEASRRTGIEFRSQEGAGVESSRVGFGVISAIDREPPAVARLDDAFRMLTEELQVRVLPEEPKPCRVGKPNTCVSFPAASVEFTLDTA